MGGGGALVWGWRVALWGKGGMLRALWEDPWVAGGETSLKRMWEELDKVCESSWWGY